MVKRKVETQLTENGKWIKGRFIYKTTRPDGTESIEECPIEAPIMSKEDYIQLFLEAGFSTTVYVGYQEREDDGQDPLLCFVCSKHQ